MWFDGWSALLRIAITGAVGFASVLALIRLGGNRTISQMNASDFIVTVAIGSTLATTMLSDRVSIAGGVTAMAVLIGIQVFSMRLSVRYPGLRQQAEGAPVPLLRQGRPLKEALHRHGVSEAELRQAIRQEGYGGFDQLAAVFLEANGRFSIVPQSRVLGGQALKDSRTGADLMPGYPGEERPGRRP